mmetsp:Transcript_9331/g.12929  ORF Transcript_9331/g.12929 Transcript_9331/m.12929 type:complete len:461 (+) Transcript_9331:31-1413(+)
MAHRHRNKGGGGRGSGNRYNSSFGPASRGGGFQANNGGNLRGGSGGGGGSGEQADARLCKFFLLGGIEKCSGGTNCHYSHCLQRVADLESSTREGNRFGAVKAVAAWNAAEGVKIFTGSKDGQVRMWNALSWNLENSQQLNGEVHCLACENNLLAAGFEGEIPNLPGGIIVGLARIFDLASGRIWELKMPGSLGPPTPQSQQPVVQDPSGGFAHAGRVYAIALRTFSPTTLECFTGGHEGEIHCWQLTTDQPDNFSLVARIDACASSGHVLGVTSLLLFGPHFLVSGSMDKTVRVWRVGSATEPLPSPTIRPLEGIRTARDGGHTEAITCTTALSLPTAIDSSGGVFFVTGSLDASFRAWDVHGNLALEHKTSAPVTALATTADRTSNTLLLVGLQDGNIEIRQPSLRFKLRAILNFSMTQGHRGEVRAFTTGDGYFCSVGNDGHLMVWQWTGNLPPPSG